VDVLVSSSALKGQIVASSPRYITDNSQYNIPERHLDTTNILFADGHVKALNLDALAEPATGAINTGYPKRFTDEAD
jgi:prepilin-type processing-associated H-X9-DG protein